MRSARFVVVAVVACQANTSDNFINPPPGVPATCMEIASLPGCNQGSISYSCTSDRPDDVGSDAGKGDTAQLVCSDGSPGAGSAMLYCCIPFSQYFADCTVDTTIPGCGATSVGFACGSQIAPSNADGTIACSGALAGSGSATDYCCNTAETPPECTIGGSATACPGVAVGYTCATGSTPADGDPSLACAPGVVGSGATSSAYCCVPFATSTDTCVIDDSLDCAAGQYAFRCSGANTPEALDPALTCAEGTMGYCCSVTELN